MKTGKRNPIEFRRSFLAEGLPSPITAADSHLQIFDNYIEDSPIRLRSIRNPETKEWARFLEKPLLADNAGKMEVSQIELSENEYERFKIFKGKEIRKNRYFCEFGGVKSEIDIFLGALWGLNIAKVYFEGFEAMVDYEPPKSLVAEITSNEFYLGEKLVGKTFADVQEKFAKEKGE